MKTAKDVLKSIKDNDVKYVDLRFTDPRGKWQHVTFDVSMIDEDIFADGTMFDGSSIAGWKAINESDMCLMPDPVTAVIDPFFAADHHGHVLRRARADHRPALQPRPARHRQEGRSLWSSRWASATPSFRPGSRVLRVRRRALQTTPYNTGFKLDSIEGCRSIPTPNMRAAISATASAPRAATSRCRRRTRAGHARRNARRMAEMGVKVEKHHHEVASAQHELGMKFDTLTLMADQMQIYKYCIHQVATGLRQDRDLHAEADLWRQRLGHACPPVDLEGRQAAVRRQQICRPVGDLPVLHRRHHQARQGDQRLHQPSTNSYKRLVPGFEAPVLLAYSARNRSASCRIPYTSNPKAKRVEVRFPDPMANPYLGFAAMLMAGLDGIKNKIHPGPRWTRTSTTCRRKS
jgi:glutamine synthetase